MLNLSQSMFIYDCNIKMTPDTSDDDMYITVELIDLHSPKGCTRAVEVDGFVSVCSATKEKNLPGSKVSGIITDDYAHTRAGK